MSNFVDLCLIVDGNAKDFDPVYICPTGYINFYALQH